MQQEIPKQWSLVSSMEPTNISTMTELSGKGVTSAKFKSVTSNVNGTVHQLFRTSQIKKYISSRPYQSAWETRSNHSKLWALASSTKKRTALSSTNYTAAIKSRRESSGDPSCIGLRYKVYIKKIVWRSADKPVVRTLQLALLVGPESFPNIKSYTFCIITLRGAAPGESCYSTR